MSAVRHSLSKPLWCAVFALYVFGSSAVGQAQEGPDSSHAAKSSREGTYGGAVPGQPATDKPKRKNALSWIGFQPAEDGSARVFLRLANELSYEQFLDGKTLVVHIDGARFRHRNTSRRLDVRFFGTALSQITSKRVSRSKKRGDRPARKAGIQVRIQFLRDEDVRPAQASMKAENDGYTYLYLDFAAPASAGTIKVSDPE